MIGALATQFSPCPNLYAFASMADVAKGGDGAESAWREIFVCLYPTKDRLKSRSLGTSGRKGPPLEIEFVHIFFGAIGPAAAVNDLIVHQADLVIAGYTKVHAVSDLLTVQYHHRHFVHEVTGIC